MLPLHRVRHLYIENMRCNNGFVWYGMSQLVGGRRGSDIHMDTTLHYEDCTNVWYGELAARATSVAAANQKWAHVLYTTPFQHVEMAGTKADKDGSQSGDA